MTHLFLFTLSPVQTFIAQARKAQDLYAGSRILSELSKAAAMEAGKQGVSLIFPTSTEGQSFPNRFIGRIEGNLSETELRKKGESIEEAVQTAFMALAKTTLKTVNLDAPDGFDTQIAEHLDINWLFYQVKATYEAAYQEVEALMAALKNERYHTNENPEQGRKCSLDGERNALFFGQGTNRKYIHQNKAKIVKTGVWLTKNEGLSAVSLVKRAYKDAEGRKFPSTAKVALGHQIKNLSEAQEKLYTCYKKLFSNDFIEACVDFASLADLETLSLQVGDDSWRKEKEFDEQLLFEENLTENNVPNKDQLRIAKALQKKLAKDLNHKYYAIIAFDGDKMGALLSGETRKDKNEDLAVFQGRVSEKLGEFSKWIYEHLDNKSGETEKGKMDVIYAGGDDFRGLVNLNDLFEVATRLRKEFDEQVNKALRSEVDGDITFSMGITIAHYKEPLSIVLRTTREMEKLAKSKGERNAFAIAALKHSGDNHKAYFKWDGEKDMAKWNALKDLVGHFQNDCSETFARSLELEFYGLKDGQGKMENAMETLRVINPDTKLEERKEINMLETELLRLSRRSLPDSQKDNAGCLKNTVMNFFEPEAKKINPKIDVQNGLEAVNIALFLKRKNKLTEAEKKQYGTQN